MNIIEVDEKGYQEKIKKDFCAFSTVQFQKTNIKKVERVRYFLFENGKTYYGICIGEKNRQWISPFSAPFNLFTEIKHTSRISVFQEVIRLLKEKAVEEKIKKLKFTLPPLFYDFRNIVYWENAFLSNGFKIENYDINYQFDLRRISIDYEKYIARNARKNLHIALKSNLEFCHCETESGIIEAYKVIAENRLEKGYPLRMSLEQVLKTIEIVTADFFLVKKDNISIAAAQVFRITPTVAQVIYWGDIRKYTEFKPINFLAYNLIQFYLREGYHYLDIGPSTENSVPNLGLCEFKESIGCDVSPKLTFFIDIEN